VIHSPSYNEPAPQLNYFRNYVYTPVSPSSLKWGKKLYSTGLSNLNMRESSFNLGGKSELKRIFEIALCEQTKDIVMDDH